MQGISAGDQCRGSVQGILVSAGQVLATSTFHSGGTAPNRCVRVSARVRLANDCGGGDDRSEHGGEAISSLVVGELFDPFGASPGELRFESSELIQMFRDAAVHGVTNAVYTG